jgi:hypothetical protein
VRLAAIAGLALVLVAACVAGAAAATYYSTGSVAPNVTTDWKSSRDGSGSSPANFSSGDVFVIQNGHSMTTSATWAISGAGSRLWIENGGTLTATFAVTLAAGTTFQIDGGGTYVHANATAYGSSIFQGSESFAPTSTVVLNNSNSTGPSGVAFGNLTVNFTVDPGAAVNCAGNITTINGSLVVVSTSTREFRLSGNSPYALAIGGDLVLQGGTLSLASGSNAGVSYTVNLAGNFTQSGGTFTSGNAASPATVVFTGGALTATLTRSSGAFLNSNINWQVGAGKTLRNTADFGVGSLVSTSRTMTVNGTFQVEQGSWSGSAGTWSYGTGATLVFANTSGYYGPIDGTHAYWPTSGGPTNVIVQGPGGIAMGTVRTVSGTFETSGPVLDADDLTLNGVSRLNAGGSLGGSPTYGAGSTLVYATGAVVGDEWAAGTSLGVGVPQQVTVQAGSGTVSLPASTRVCPGDLTITSGTLALNAAGGELVVGGQWSHTGGAFAPNGQAVRFNGTGTQTVSAGSPPEGFGGLVVDKPSGTLELGSDVSVTYTSGDGLQLLDAGAIDLSGRTLQLSGAGGNVLVTGGFHPILGTGTLDVRGAKTVASTGGGALSLGPGVTVALGAALDFGAGLTTLGGTLRLDGGGSVSGNPPLYDVASTLVYNDAAGSDVGAEWGAGAVVGAGVPQNVTIQQGRLIGPSAPRTVPGTLSVGGGGDSLRAGGDLTVNGLLALGAGRIGTGTARVILPAGAGLTRSSGWVAGNLQLAIPAGASTPTFPIGDATAYTPVALSFGSGTTAGDLTAGVTAGTHPALGSSSISGTQHVLRYWTLTDGGVTGVYDATFTFVPADLQSGVDPDSLKVGRYDAGWTYPAVGTRTATSTRATGLTSFGDFVLGEQTGWDIIATAGAHGAIEPAGVIAVPDGGTQAFTLVPDTGYHLDSLYVDGSAVSPVSPYTFTNVRTNHTIRPTFALNTYTITASAGPHGSILPGGVTVVSHGSSQAYAIRPAVGYQVDSLIVDAATVASDTSYTFTNITTSHTIRATFMLDEPAATADVGAPPSAISSSHPSVTLPVTISRVGTTQATSFHVTFRLSSHLALTAGLGSITEGDFLTGGGRTTSFQASDLGSGIYRVDGTVTGGPCGSDKTAASLFHVALSSPAADAVDTVRVLGWSLSACDGSKLPATAGIAALVTIDNTAPVISLNAPNGGEIWVVHSPQTILWTASDAAGVASVDLAYSTNGGATYPNPIATGLANSGAYAWTIPDAQSTTVRVRATAHDENGNPAADASDANFTIGLFTLTATAGAHGTIAPPSASVAYGDSQAYAITPDPAYHVDSLTVDGAPVAVSLPYTLRNVQASHVVHVTFAIDTHPIVASAGPHGTIAPAGTVAVPNGSNQAFTLTPDPGYHVDSLVVDGLPITPASGYTFTNVTVPHTIHAAFAIDVFTILATAGTHGAIAPSGAVAVDYGADQSFTITPNPSYHVDSLVVDGAPVPPGTGYTFTHVTAAHTIHAAFAFDDFVITASAGAHGAVVPSGAVGVSAGSSRTFRIHPDPGYHVDSLVVDGLAVTADTVYTFTNIQAGHTLRATFAGDLITLTASAGPHGSIAPPGATPVAYGGSQAYTMTPDPGYHLDSLYVDGASVTPVSPYTFTGVTTSHTIHATFAIDLFTISASAGPHGSIAPPGVTPVASGGSQAYTITPDGGYHLDSLYVDAAPLTPVSPYTFTNVTASHTIRATFAVNPAVPPITALTAAQKKTGNGGAATTAIHLAWPPVGAGSTVEIYRARFGNYPEYDDGPSPGSAPAAPTSYPPSGRWALAGTVAAPGTGFDDLNTLRDFYYYVAVVTDAYGTHSAVSNRTDGTLDYHLGDVTDPADSLRAGDDLVNGADVSKLGAHYGATLPLGSPYAALDVGPTADFSVNALPLTDDILDFEDLLVFAITYSRVSAPQTSAEATAAVADRDELLLETPERVALAGGVASVRLLLRSTGAVQGLASRLSWDPAIVAPVGYAAGALAASQGALVLSARPGSVDAAVLGTGAGFRGEGVVATLTFRVLQAGDPKIRLASAEARDQQNRRVVLATSERALTPLPALTQLAPALPNPFRRTATIGFSLARGGPVELAIYAVDGRRVRTLVRGSREPGEYSLTWDGRDDHGDPMAAGVYYAHLKTAERGFTRTLTYLK